MLCADGVTMDGMTLSFKKSKARLVHNWADPHADRGVQGCPFPARVFLSDRSLRKLACAFAGPSPGAGHSWLQASSSLAYACTKLSSSMQA